MPQSVSSFMTHQNTYWNAILISNKKSVCVAGLCTVFYLLTKLMTDRRFQGL